MTADLVLKGSSRETPVIRPGQLVVEGLLITLANSIPDCVPVAQVQEEDWAHKDWRLCCSQCSCVWHPAVDTHPARGLRHSNLKLPFGQEKGSSAHITASIRVGAAAVARVNLCQM